MKLSEKVMKKKEEEKKRAVRLYQTGLSTRAVAEKIGRSRAWVWRAVYKYVHNHVEKQGK